MAGKIINYFAGGNTARGFFSLYDWALADLDKVFFLLGGPGTGKSTLIKGIGDKWIKKGFDIEYIYSAADPASVEGVMISQLKTGIVSDCMLRYITLRAPGVIEEFVNLGDGLHFEQIATQKDKIVSLNEEMRNSFKSAYRSFGEALKIHDDWEKIYIDNIDFKKANKLAENLAAKFFENKSVDKEPVEKRRFLGAATPQGSVDFVPDITEGLEKRYFFKGRPGSGKSTMLKKIVAEGKKRGFDAEIYHCGFDPYSIDMVLFRELGMCIFDSTAPHEYFPSREGDEIVELYGTIIDDRTDERYAKEIGEVSQKYRMKIKEATAHLAAAKSLNEQLEKIYTEAMDFTVVEALAEKIEARIQRLANQK